MDPHVKLTCGNETCGCGKQCGCPFGACSCDAGSIEEDHLPEKLEIGEIDLDSKETVLNINIGVLGHVNSGKTALVRALSRTLSTAALDKNPQSKERGMTLDLGFSSFATQAPAHFVGIDKIQYTLVDCPGHASLIRTIISGAQIIDRMILVIDITKGIQAQTAECLVIGEILTDDMIIVLNKLDLIPENEQADTIKQVEENLRKSLAHTAFADAPMVAISAFVDNGDPNPHPSGAAEPPLRTHNLIELVKLLRDTTKMPNRELVNIPLYFSVDHCFPIKGQGTVLTGTVMAGQARVGDEIEIPDLGVTKKIKSIQRFHRAVDRVQQGDRASFAVSNLDSKKIERCVVCSPKTIPSSSRFIALIRKVKYFERKCPSGSKIHVTVGPSTGLAKVTFFGSAELKALAKQYFGKRLPLNSLENLLPNHKVTDWEYDEELKTGGKLAGGPVLQFALLEFESPIPVPQLVQLICSRLDLNESAAVNTCRIAFYGRVTTVIPENEPIYHFIKVFKSKEKIGVVDRVDVPKGAPSDTKVDQLIGRGFFKKDTDISAFLGLKVFVQLKSKGNDEGGNTDVYTDESVGHIDSSFGKTGKFKVYFRGQPTAARAGDRLVLKFKKYLLDSPDKKQMIQ